MRQLLYALLCLRLITPLAAHATDWEVVDQDGDHHDASVDCDDDNPDTWPGREELCDGLDNNCDGAVDAYEADQDQDGVPICAGDCDDQDDSVAPGLPESANDADDDCDGVIDEETVYGDDDGDGYSESAAGASAARPFAGDCDDTDSSIHPGVADPSDPADGIDNNCDGNTDGGADELDQDGDGQRPLDGDCDDLDATRYPGAPEVTDGWDSDCDGFGEPLYGCGATRSALWCSLGLLLWPRWRRRTGAVALSGAISLGGTGEAWAQEEVTRPSLGAADLSEDLPPPAVYYYSSINDARAAHEALLMAMLPRMDAYWADQIVYRALTHERPLAYDAARDAERRAQASGAAGATHTHETTEDAEQRQAALARVEAEIARGTQREAELREGLQAQIVELDRLWVGSLELPWWRQVRELALTGQWSKALALLAPPTPPWPLDLRPTLLQDLLQACEDTRTQRQALEEQRGALLTVDLLGPPSPPPSAPMGEPSLTDLLLSRALEDANTRVGQLDVELRTLEQRSAQQAEAAAVRAQWDRLLVAAVAGPLPLSADAWTELFWRHGSAALLAGDEEAGWRSLRQAVAVAGRAPDDVHIPVSVQTLLSVAERQLSAQPLAMLRVSTTPSRTVLIDGREAAATVGYVQQPLLPGLHLVVVGSPQDAAPLVTVVRLESDEVRDVVWYPENAPATDLPVEEGLGGMVGPGVPRGLPQPPHRTWEELEAGAQVWMVANTALVGPSLAVRVGSGHMGGALEASMLNAQSPILIDRDRAEQTFGAISAGLTLESTWGRGGLGLLIGAQAVSLLAVGPDLSGCAFIGGERWNLVAKARLGYDLSQHEEAIPRLQVGAGLGLRVSVLHQPRITAGENPP